LPKPQVTTLRGDTTRFNKLEFKGQMMNSQTPHPTKPATRLIPVPEWKEHHSWPPEGGLRHMIFNRETNGFASAFKKVGRRVLIDEAEFFACIERKNGSA
jgi:hypothetical protein